MKTYEWILFDADETLFHFDAFTGLQRMFFEFNVTFTEKDYAEYQIINQSLWVDYQNGTISAKQLQQQRFSIWANHLQIPAQDLSDAFSIIMATISIPLEGAVNMLNTLKNKVKLGIITNGFTKLQQPRLEHTGLTNHFDLLVVSEEVGIAKPHPGIFEHALSLMGNPSRDQVLMVGDTFEADIIGGINAGLDTCWLNVNGRPAPEGITPRYQVSSLTELESILLGKTNILYT